MKKPIIKILAWSSHKILRRSYDKIIVDASYLKTLKKLQDTKKNPIVFVPTRKSYVDLPLLAYVFYAYGLQHPFFSVPAQYRDIRLLNHIMHSSGAFFVQDRDTPLYNAVLHEYICSLMHDNQILVASIEESRERFGMMVKSNTKILASVVNGFLDGKSKDVDIIPITINYDRILEGETFPYELVGEDPGKESLSRFISSARYIGTPFGK